MKNFSKKKLLTFGVLGLFAMILVSAGLVTYWKGTQVDITVVDSFDVEEVVCELTVTAGDRGYELCLFEATNNLDRFLAVNFELKVQKKDSYGVYQNLVDDAGVYVGLSEDLQYAYSDEYGQCSDWACAEVWMMNNLNWFDWDVLTQEYPGEYRTDIILGPELGGRTGYMPLEDGVLEIPQEVPGDYEIHSVIYVGSGLNLESGDYRVILDAVSVSEVS